MQLLAVKTTRPSEGIDIVRITARIEFDDGESIEIWFEVPTEFEHQLADTSNPWLLCMLPYAVERGEPLRSDLPADPALIENLKGLMATWHQWYPWLKPVRLEVPRLSSSAEVGSDRTAAFFSGGVDSWFTVLRHVPERESRAIGRVDDLIYVHGFDIPLDRTAEFRKIQLVLEEAARDLDKALILVKTNLRRPKSPWAHDWGWLSHAAGLGAVAMILEKRFGRVLIGSTHPYGRLMPWGSHPMSDVLMSTSRLQVQHDGAMYNRVEKTELVARHPSALKGLHVCWKSGAASNCGVCSKCIRTMATLRLMGVTPRDVHFQHPFESARLSQLYLADQNDEDFIQEVFEAARERGDTEIEAAAGYALRRSRRVRPWVRFLDRLESVPLLWRLRVPCRRFLLSS